MDTFDENTKTMVYSDGSGRAGIETAAGAGRYVRHQKKYVYAMVLGRIPLYQKIMDAESFIADDSLWNERTMRLAFIRPYAPPVRYRFFSRYGNGITLRFGRLGLHIWWPR